MKWSLVYTKQAQKDAKKLTASGLKKKAKDLLNIVETNPYQNPPPYEKLVGDLAGAYSRRINIQHRLVYQVIEKERTVKVIRLWTHYE
ncbi:MAG: Txe/YoeB family addiction module toxin [Gammaproteobacteria bacterium]|nr:Txe/YoeB family addiction module toxin [Gammaproteobacteria bacterium]MBT4131051.1 Txe/YoeB family addiction module toxin [Candidatus Neomarinimicrobiota bacterium]MBT4330919.1 Txe/YoeB family addiction module toxin [Gammaproteobacteria bacterium]MBT5745171.1 Txe/YoeB family addiction module toxin [Gammaproteobacteria bacterium]MBT6669047.1 Txe/YoeB family addiction module toxin [Gammaproteobacteria bacterium]